MADELKTENETIAENPVTDGDLDSAFEQFLNKTPKSEEPAPSEEEPKEELEEKSSEEKLKAEDNAERSKLGRKVKSLEDLIGKLMDKLDNQTPAPSKTKHTEEIEDDDEVPETIVTPADLEKYLAIKARKESAEQNKYTKTYIATVYENQDKDDNFDEILSLMKTDQNFDVVYTKDPRIDAELNYNKAARAILAKKLAKPAKKEVPLKGDSSGLATGLSGSERKTEAKKSLPKLDDHALDFVKRMEMSEADVLDALSGETPLNLGGARS